MNDFNDRQREYLRQYGLTEEEITSGKTDPAHRLEIANRAGKDEPAEEEPEVETVEETDAQKAYRGNRTREQITSAVDIENYEALGGEVFRKRIETEAPVEASKPLPEAPVIVGPHTQYDMDKIAALSPWRRNEIADFIRLVQGGLKANPSLNDRASLEQARLHLTPYVLKK